MDIKHIQILSSIIVYLVAMIIIGIYYARRANKSSAHYFIGGRTLGPWVSALSAEASDMSGWLMIGLPGVCYWLGLADAAWTAIGLLIGTYLNWLFVSKRLRKYSFTLGDAISVPDFFSKRYREDKPLIRSAASVFILVFFAVYAAACFLTGGKLFSAVFGAEYRFMMYLCALFVIAYTLIGGFLADSATDFIQAILILFALVVAAVTGIATAGGPAAVLENIRDIPGFAEFFSTATPEVNAAGVQQLAASGDPLFGKASPYGTLAIISALSWGLAYFGMPQILLRFMAIRRTKDLPRSRRIAVVWCALALFTAIVIGLTGRALYPSELLTAAASENIFIHISNIFLHPILLGVVMTGILAVTMSSSDSYLLIATSALSLDLFKGVLKKGASDRQVMIVSRFTLLAVAAAGMLIASNAHNIIFLIVSFAWAGFGATFGPLMLFSLFWKRTTEQGALAGMIGGAAMVFLWKLIIRPLGGVFGIYELLPAFLFSSILIIVISLKTPKPSEEIAKEFETAKRSSQ